MKNILRLARQRLIDWYIRGYAATSTKEIQDPVLLLRGRFGQTRTQMLMYDANGNHGRDNAKLNYRFLL